MNKIDEATEKLREILPRLHVVDGWSETEIYKALDLLESLKQEIDKLKRYAAGIEADGTEPYKDMIIDIRAAFGNRANSTSISDADLLRQIYETLEGKP